MFIGKIKRYEFLSELFEKLGYYFLGIAFALSIYAHQYLFAIINGVICLVAFILSFVFYRKLKREKNILMFMIDSGIMGKMVKAQDEGKSFNEFAQTLDLNEIVNNLREKEDNGR